MEDVLEVYCRPYNEKYPVVCMDEKHVQFFADFSKGYKSNKSGVLYDDYQYIWNGTACIFMFTEPLSGWRYKVYILTIVKQRAYSILCFHHLLEESFK